VKELHWTNQAILALASLTGRERRALLDHLDLLAQFPAMYPARRRGRFAGLRYFVLERRWIIYYRLAEEDPILVFAIVPALARPR
jgi:plasmid stabilization system protein ParE